MYLTSIITFTCPLLLKQSSSPPWELELRPLGVATGNALSVTRVWRYICKNTTCWPATAHDVTTSVPQYKCRRENTSSAFSSSLTGLFEACNLVRVQFSLSIKWRALARRLRLCVDPRPRYWHPMTHTIFASFVWARSTHAMSLRGNLRALWAFSIKAPLSSCPSFEERGAAVCFPRFGTHRCRGTEVNEISSWMWPMSERGTAPFLSQGSPLAT